MAQSLFLARFTARSLTRRASAGRFLILLTAFGLGAGACSSGDPESTPETDSAASEPVDLDPAADVEIFLDGLDSGFDSAAISRIGQSGDERYAWLIADLMRFVNPGPSGLAVAFEELTGEQVGAGNPWREANDYLIAADLPAPDNFQEWKSAYYLIVEPRWEPFFTDPDALVDWRHLTWGGVYIDDRPIGETDTSCPPPGCIPAIDDPLLVSAAEGDYYPDEAVVFAVVVNDEAVAFPKNMMEVHEMVNITIGGRRIGIPYCTLCGSAQAYYIDEVPESVAGDLDGAETFELRTSGLLTRSNKAMYEFHTRSLVDTFTGQALSGPLREAGVELEQLTVVASSWGDWKAAHPDTMIVAEDGGIGRVYLDDPLGGRDDAGPIFPTGDVDPRLAAQEPVVGVIVDGQAVAFPVANLSGVLDDDSSTLEFEGIAVGRDGGGFRAFDSDGAELAAHQAFWFAWSQFHPDTFLWQV